MLKAIRDRLDRKEEGFTLIELMVVVLIIAILIAIAIPTFLGAKKRAQDKQAQSNLRNALTAEKTIYVDGQEYTDVVADLDAVEPNLEYLQAGTAQAEDREVRVEVADTAEGGAVTKNLLVLSSESRSGTVFCIADIGNGVNAGTYFAKGAGCEDDAEATVVVAAAPQAPWENNSEDGW
jgi:type IV pilus assembly protein PilA